VSSDVVTGVVVEETTEKERGFFFVVDSDDDAGIFRARSTMPRWAVMKVAVAAKKGDETEQMVALLDLCNAVLKDDAERARFDAYMNAHDDALERLEDSLTNLFTSYSEGKQERPLPRTSSSSETSNETPPRSRVVSLSRGTVQVVEPETNSSTASA